MGGTRQARRRQARRGVPRASDHVPPPPPPSIDPHLPLVPLVPHTRRPPSLIDPSLLLCLRLSQVSFSRPNQLSSCDLLSVRWTTTRVVATVDPQTTPFHHRAVGQGRHPPSGHYPVLHPAPHWPPPVSFIIPVPSNSSTDSTPLPIPCFSITPLTPSTPRPRHCLVLTSSFITVTTSLIAIHVPPLTHP